MTTTKPQSISGAALWAGRILGALVILFMLFDAGVKVLKLDMAVKGTAQVGYPVSTVVPIGWACLISVILYAVPQTSILGAILLTGYLGGAVATNVRISSPLGFDFLPAIIGALAWAALWLRDERLRAMIPVQK
jgi:hypothetical protein